ncbi:MAG: ABC transporter ATP-binding protein [Spirochaetales bacterium]|nr:MAG: ABC transporter ATP-binding protein [Spirochaetales bacterium]
MSEAVIITDKVSKNYDKFQAVIDLSLSIYSGEVFGLLGPNGSGKTTTILMLLGLTEPSAGNVSVLGFDPMRHSLEVKRRVGYLPDAVGFYDEMTARDNLVYTTRLAFGTKVNKEAEIMEVLGRMNLREVAGHKVRTFSRGMRQKLGLAEILIKKPSIVILDEPTNGLDPESAVDFLGLVLSLKQEGITVLLSSHLLHQVQSVCDRVGFFHKGRKVLEGTVPELAAHITKGRYKLYLEAADCDPEKEMAGIREISSVEKRGDNILAVESETDLRAEIGRRIISAGGRLLLLRQEEPDLDEVYARYFKGARDENLENG